MSVSINLLPEVRQQKHQAKTKRRLAVTISTIITLVSVGALAIMFVWAQAQDLRIKMLTNDIAEKRAEVKAVENLQTMLTTQANLAELPTQYSRRVYLSKFVNLLPTVSPRDFALTEINSEDTQIIKFSGRSKSMATIEKFVKALEASNIVIGQGASSKNVPHFSAVNTEKIDVQDNRQFDFEISATLSQEVLSGN